MRRIGGLVLAAALAAAPAFGQVALKPGLPFILQWTPAQQSQWYRAMETVYKVQVIRRGRTVHPLPVAAKSIDPAFTHGGKSYTVDSYMAAYNVSGVLAIKDGKIVLERYAMGRKPEDRWTSFSVAKSVTSTLVGAAIQDGKIKSLNDPVTRYIPELRGSGYDGVTVRQLLMMSSGVKWNEDYADPKSDVAVAGTTVEDPKVNPIVSYMRKLPRAHEPGSTFNYNTGETDLVGVLVSNAVGKPLAQYASEKIWKPYGMEQDGIWVTDQGGHERGGCCMSMTLRDWGRIGQFILDGGKAGGRQIVPADWVAQATSPQITGPSTRERGYGYFWWMPDSGAYEARGIYGQSITTFRDERLIIVTNAAWPVAGSRELSTARNAFIAAVREAAKGL